MNIELFLFRHGQTDWNLEERLQGHEDIPLNGTGRLQAAALAESLRESGIEVVLSSDLSRALETARAVGEVLGIPVHSHAGLRERLPGKLQGLTRSEIIQHHGQDWFEWLRTDEGQGPTHLQIEDREEVELRALRAIARFISGNRTYRRIGISTHEGVLRRLISALGDPGASRLPIENARAYRVFWPRA